MRPCVVASIFCLVLTGCGRGAGVTVVPNPGVREAVVAFELAASEAKGNVQAAAVPLAGPGGDSSGLAGGGDEEGLPTPEQQIVSAVQMVASSAQDLVRTAAGTSQETEAKAIEADSQELLKKAKARASAAEIKQGLDQLLSKAGSMKK